MGSEKDLEQRTNLVFNPRGPDKKATEELIKVLSKGLNSPVPDGNDYTRELIKAVKEGYEMQSGQKYKGFLPRL